MKPTKRPKPIPNPNSAEFIRIWERRTRVVAALADGVPIPTIAENEGIDPQTVRNDISKEMARRAAEWENVERRDAERHLQAAKLDAMEAKLWPRLDEPRGWDRAAHALIRVHERRANLLGLDTVVVREQLARLEIDVRLSDGSLPPGSDIIDGEIVEQKELGDGSG